MNVNMFERILPIFGYQARTQQDKSSNSFKNICPNLGTRRTKNIHIIFSHFENKFGLTFARKRKKIKIGQMMHSLSADDFLDL
jgi:hypothetical protein